MNIKTIMTKKSFIVFSCLILMAQLQCSSSKDSAKYIDSYCLRIRLQPDSVTIKWEEDPKILATFYNRCSSTVKIRNPFSMPFDGIISITDSAGNELDREWINSKRPDKYSELLPNDSLTVPVKAVIWNWYYLPDYGTYYLKLKYQGHLPDEYRTVSNDKDSSVYSNVVKIEYVK
jgi:hypothetical protein